MNDFVHWMLDEHGEPMATHDTLAWARWFENSGEQRRIARTTIAPSVEVSTVYLGIDHSFGGDTPVLWESMIFGGPLDGKQARYTSRAEALIGHDEFVAAARAQHP